MNLALDRPASAVSHLDSILAITPIKSASPSDRDYLGVAEVYALAGRADEAKAILTQRTAEVRDTAKLRVQSPKLNRMLGEIDIAEGHPAEVILYLWKGDSPPDGPLDECDLCTYTLVGPAYDKANQPDSAIKYYEKSSASTYTFRGGYDMSRAPIERRLGELYEAKGDRDRAVKHYQAFVDFWKDAEPELQPQVAEVRKRLARLGNTERALKTRLSMATGVSRYEDRRRHARRVRARRPSSDQPAGPTHGVRSRCRPLRRRRRRGGAD